MNKYRIRTTDGQWLYTTLKPVDDRILSPWLDKHGQQMLDPRVKFRPETFTRWTGFILAHPENDAIKDNEIFDGDIVAHDTSAYLLIRWDGKAGMWLGKWEQWEENLEDLLIEDKPRPYLMGNIFENPQLLENK